MRNHGRIHKARGAAFRGLVGVMGLIWLVAGCTSQPSSGGPAGAPAGPSKSILSFRIAPASSALAADQVKAMRDALASGDTAPKSGGANEAGYLWLPARSGAAFDQLITADHGGQKYVLLSNQPADVMLPGGWGLQSVQPDRDEMGRPSVLFRFDAQGAALFEKLTKAHVGQVLAIIVDGKVLSAPVIRSVIRDSGIISGTFTDDEVNRLAAALKAGMPPKRWSSQTTWDGHGGPPPAGQRQWLDRASGWG
ncbi:MAG: hypothetical protein ACE15C_18385 [Phycisphaerae bacterium]